MLTCTFRRGTTPSSAICTGTFPTTDHVVSHCAGVVCGGIVRGCVVRYMSVLNKFRISAINFCMK